jgi:hypothetical protein
VGAPRAMVGVQEHPEFIVVIMIDVQQTLQHT